MLDVRREPGAGSAECSFATSDRKRSGGVRSDHMQKIFEDASALFGEERFGMKQYAFYCTPRQAAPHDMPVFTPRRHFKLRSHAGWIHH